MSSTENFPPITTESFESEGDSNSVGCLEFWRICVGSQCRSHYGRDFVVVRSRMVVVVVVLDVVVVVVYHGETSVMCYKSGDEEMVVVRMEAEISLRKVYLWILHRTC